MFKISEFSKLSQVSVKNLRYYDQLNLFKPAFTDHESGYRYYTADQLFQLHRILAFKALGFTLNQIKKLLVKDISLDQIRGMFQLKEAELQAEIEKKQARLKCIEHLLVQLENEGFIGSKHDVVLKKIESTPIVSLRKRGPISGVSDLFEQLEEDTKHLKVAGHQKIVLWHGCEEGENEVDLEIGFLLKKSTTPSAGRTLPPVPLMATLVHPCHPSKPCLASRDLGIWIEQNGFQIREDEPRREIFLHLEQGNPDSYIAEVQIPVK